MLSAESTNTELPTPSKQIPFTKLNLADEDWDAPAKEPEALPEPLLVPNNKRFVLFPIQYHDVWTSYKNAEARFWSAEEIELSEDVDGWETLSGKEKAAIRHAIIVFSTNDMLEGEPIISKLSDEIQIPEARCFFGFQLMQKNIHAELFNLLVDLFHGDNEEKEIIFNTVRGLAPVSKRQAWIQRHLTESRKPFATRLAAFAVHNMIFNNAAATILMHLAAPTLANARDRPMPGMIHGLAKVDIDHNRYVKFGKTLLNHCANKVTQSVMQELVMEAVNIEKEMAQELLGAVGGVTTGTAAAFSASMSLTICGSDVSLAKLSARVEMVADQLMTIMGFKPIYANSNLSKEKESLRWIDQVLEAEVRKDEPVVEEKKTERKAPPQASSSIEQSFTPTYDADLYNMIFAFHGDRSKKLAVDIGSGTGQATIELAKYFENVVGVEPSDVQRQASIQAPNVTYVKGTSSEFPTIASDSADVVTVAQAAHWFDMPSFYNEASLKAMTNQDILLKPHIVQVRRVLKKKQVVSGNGTPSTVLDGTLAIFGYSFFVFPNRPNWTREAHHFGTVTLEKYWDPRRVIIDNLYADLEMPPTTRTDHEGGLPAFTTFERRLLPSAEYPYTFMKKSMPLRGVAAYLKTWSAYKTYMDTSEKKKSAEMLDPVDALLEGWILESNGTISYDTVVEVEWPMVLVLAK
ncbi:Ribonucleoside-diphosphate reductase subunit M2 [Chytridiales sp. JEL 0842]|nr:Ribonucleoside-diphosphate reductase subunit M2 [Chytridiales sp. JEL 0842]